MRGRYIGALVLFVIVLAAAMFAYVRTRPKVSEADVADALAEVEVLRASLEEVACHRPPLFGPLSEGALSLDDLLRRRGPFAECWRAAERAHTRPLEYRMGSDFETHHSHWAPDLMGPDEFESIVTSCAGLPEELALQARTPNRCAPYPANREGHFTESYAYFPEAVATLARYGDMPDRERLRLVVQGMAVARDLSQGPTGFHRANDATRVENRLGAVLASLLEKITPDSELRAELEHALQLLAEVPTNAHALFAVQAIHEADRAPGRRHSGPLGPSVRLRVFAAATLVSRIAESCPAGGSVEACVAHFPYARPQHPSSFEYMLGPRLSQGWSVGNKHHTATIHYADNALPLEAVRANARGLQEILRWSTQMAEGSCPEVSSWAFDANDDRYYVDQRESLYRLVIPGAEQSSFYFECSIP